MFGGKKMRKGRKVQREWSKVPGGNNSSSEVSPKSDLQSDRMELPSRVKEARTGKRNGGENLQKSVLKKSYLARFGTLFKLAIGGLILLFLFNLVTRYVKSPANDSHSVKLSKEPEARLSDSEFKNLFSKKNSLIDWNHRIDIGLEEVVAYIRQINDANLTMADFFKQLGKAALGHTRITSDGSRESMLTYFLTDHRASLHLNFSEKEEQLLLDSVEFYTIESQRKPTERTSNDYSALLPQPGNEGMELMEAIKELGVPDWLYSSFLPGTKAQIAISYKASDEMRVTLYFDQVGEVFRLGNMTKIEDKKE